MFKLVEERRAWQPVTFPGLTEEGERVDNRVEMQFLLLPTDELVELLRQAREMDNAPPAEGDKVPMSRQLAAFAMKFVRDWRLVAEANGDPVKFNEESLARLFNVPGVFQAALLAYRDACAGGKDAREKN